MSATIPLSPEQIALIAKGEAVQHTINGYNNPISLQLDKEKSDRKILLVQYELTSGEYGTIGHTVIITTKRRKNENAVDEAFKGFYGNGNLDESSKANYYLYHMGGVAVKIQKIQEITGAQYEVLREVGVA